MTKPNRGLKADLKPRRAHSEAFPLAPRRRGLGRLALLLAVHSEGEQYGHRHYYCGIQRRIAQAPTVHAER